MKKSFLAILALAALVPAASGQVFVETFDGLANGDDITTSNTDFTYVRIGTGGGVIDAVNPANVGSGSSLIITQDSSTTSLNGVGVGNTLPSSNVYSFSLDFRPLSLAGDVIFGVGSGTTFTGNSGFSTADGLFWLQSDNGNFERRTGAGDWVNVGSGFTFSIDTNYTLGIIANGSAALQNYTVGSVAAGTMDIYVNGTLLENDAPVTNSLSADGFRVYQISQGNFEADNFRLWNSATAAAIPEPTALALLGAASLALSVIRRRRTA